jgi:transposase
VRPPHRFEGFRFALTSPILEGFEGRCVQQNLQSLLANAPRRVEVLNGPTGRRRWPPELRSQMVAETLLPGVKVVEVARRYGVKPQYITSLRTLARKGKLVAADPEPAFAPLVVEAPARSRPSESQDPIVVTVGDVSIKLPSSTSMAQVAKLVQQLRRPA